MPETDTGTIDDLIDAMLDIVADDGWRAVTLEAVAAGAGASPGDARAACSDRAGLLNAFARRVDAAACRDAEPGADEVARYDELLDIMMRRFEVLQARRAAVERLIRELPGDPLTMLKILPQGHRTFAGLARAAGYDDRGPPGLALAKALAAVWLVTQCDWLRDDTPDLAVTMASLDRNLRRAMGVLEPLLRSRGEPDRSSRGSA